MLGVFSKIYTHGGLRPLVVPHMGLVTPLTPVYDWLDTCDEVEVIEGPDGVQLRLVLAAANATRSAAQALDIVYTAAGGTANYLNSPLQRALRNIHALTQHFVTSPQQWERGGRMLLGLDPSFPFFLL